MNFLVMGDAPEKNRARPDADALTPIQLGNVPTSHSLSLMIPQSDIFIYFTLHSNFPSAHTIQVAAASYCMYKQRTKHNSTRICGIDLPSPSAQPDWFSDVN